MTLGYFRRKEEISENLEISINYFGTNFILTLYNQSEYSKVN